MNALRAILVIFLIASSPSAADPPAAQPSKLVVVSDDNYPPYLFRTPEGTLQGIIRDKWDLWSRRTGVPVEVMGMSWTRAQEAVIRGEADVIEALAQTPARARQYEYPNTPASIQARVYFHKSVTGIKDAISMRGFTVAAKAGSACAEWLKANGVASIRTYPDSPSLISAAATGEVRMFCMDTFAAEYFLFKHNIADEFRMTPVLYSAPFDWAVKAGRPALRDFIQDGFSRVRRAEVDEIDARWRGNPLQFPIGARYIYTALAAGIAVLVLASILLLRNQSLSRRVYGKTAELLAAVDSLKKQSARAQYLATRDPLTDLANRQLLLDQLARTLSHSARRNRPASVLAINLDRFKAVNDTFGQDFGDRVLQQTAARLTRCATARDIVARMSADEFVMMLPRTAPDGAAELAARVLREIHEPFDIDGQRVYCTASIGIAAYPGDGTTAAELVRNADIAVDCAKENGRNNFQLYRAEMQLLAARRLELETDLRHALERHEFELHYQPRVSLISGRISGLEALLRWHHPRHGLIMPGEFIPILEDSGIIVAVGEWVLRTACEQARRWQRQGLARTIAVNLSARQFHQRDLDQVIARIIEETGIDPTLLELELTESVLMREPEEAANTLRNLEAMGVRLAIDDFGTGYSSLAYLKRFPIESLKIDRSFIRDVTGNPEDAAITHAIIQLAHSLGLRVVAEGVETSAQLTYLRDNGCDEVQGFLFSAPLNAKAAQALIAASVHTPETSVQH
ncbi:MAG TPA: EAL domain-containing protein [Usitatibacter sp.]|nr:EAL domain-containing protein [Usitatibacter sp.]